MVEQGTKVYPDTPFLQHAVDHLDKLNDVVSAVDEEGGDDGILTGQVVGLAVDVNKVAGSHGEPGVLRKLAGVNIWEVDCYQLVTALNMVAIIVEVRVDFETVNSGGLVEDKITGEQHEQAELVALAFKTLSSDFKGKSAKPRSRHQHLLLTPAATVRIEGSQGLRRTISNNLLGFGHLPLR